MQAKTKIILIITGSVLIAGGLAVGLYFLLRKPAPEDEMQDIIDKGGSNSGGGTTNQTGNSFDTGSDNNNSNTTLEINPKFNSEGELTNSLAQLKGRVLYPKRTATGGWGYTNVRASAEVNTDQGWWDPSDNLITTINSGTQIGKVLSETTGLFNGYSYRWFKVKLTKPTGGFWSNYTEGYVRADTVIFQAYTP